MLINRWTQARPTLRVETVLLVVVTYLVATANGPWWHAITTGHDWSRPATWLFVSACFVLLVALHFLLLGVITNRWTLKPLLTLIVIASAAAAYFMRSFAVLMDPTMVQNILRTDSREAHDLISWTSVGAVVLWSALPLAFIWLVRVERQPWLRSLWIRLASLAAALTLAALAALLVSRELVSLMRNQHEIRYLITPGNLLYGIVDNLTHEAKLPAGPKAVIGADARLIPQAAGGKPRVFVLVVGETARAANFSLFGYARDTNPELAKLDIIGFSNVKSCGTSTEVSLPCMFSPFGRADYDEQQIRGSEGLLNVLVRAGYAVHWIDNQSGCKGVCEGAGIEYLNLETSHAPDLCGPAGCYDDILVRRLASELAQTDRNTVIVLHMMGNHGPAYFRRYPPQFRRFLPDCPTAQLRNCAREEVVNSYDNAILYTDHVLAALVGVLRAQTTRLDTAMLYVSDHGESLGENGLYLHGIPYPIAPQFQTHVPMITWLSAELAAATRVDLACLRARSAEKLSHDNVFHSMLGLLDVQTSVYRPERDLFAPCRAARTGT
jgi:lipid A ethanolaminephosphotransferase